MSVSSGPMHRNRKSGYVGTLNLRGTSGNISALCPKLSGLLSPESITDGSESKETSATFGPSLSAGPSKGYFTVMRKKEGSTSFYEHEVIDLVSETETELDDESGLESEDDAGSEIDDVEEEDVPSPGEDPEEEEKDEDGHSEPEHEEDKEDLSGDENEGANNDGDEGDSYGGDEDSLSELSSEEESSSSDEDEDEDEEPFNGMKLHHDFMKDYHRNTGGKTKPFSAASAAGEYVIHCDEISRNYGGDDDILTLRIINPHGDINRLVGIFDFNVIEGIMRLGRNAEILQEAWSEDEGSSDEDEDGAPTPRKRKASEDLDNQNKKQKTSGSSLGLSTRTLHLLWRGRETGECQIEEDFDNSNKGQITFDDDACLTFSGTWDSGFFGKDVQFSGYRISHDGGKVDKAWTDYAT